MKKLLAFLLTFCMILPFAACKAKDASVQDSASSEGPLPSVSELRTLGDAFHFESNDNGFSRKHYVYVFEADGTYYRAIADLPDDVSDTIWAIDIFDETYDEQVRSAVAPLEIAKLENLSESSPSQQELDAFVGRNVQDLLDEGWSFWYWNMETMEGGMNYGPYSYQLTYEGSVENPDDFDESQANALTVKSIQYEGIGDAVSDVLNADGEEDIS